MAQIGKMQRLTVAARHVVKHKQIVKFDYVDGEDDKTYAAASERFLAFMTKLQDIIDHTVEYRNQLHLALTSSSLLAEDFNRLADGAGSDGVGNLASTNERARNTATAHQQAWKLKEQIEYSKDAVTKHLITQLDEEVLSAMKAAVEEYGAVKDEIYERFKLKVDMKHYSEKVAVLKDKPKVTDEKYERNKEKYATASQQLRDKTNALMATFQKAEDLRMKVLMVDLPMVIALQKATYEKTFMNLSIAAQDAPKIPVSPPMQGEGGLADQWAASKEAAKVKKDMLLGRAVPDMPADGTKGMHSSWAEVPLDDDGAGGGSSSAGAGGGGGGGGGGAPPASQRSSGIGTRRGWGTNSQTTQSGAYGGSNSGSGHGSLGGGGGGSSSLKQGGPGARSLSPPRSPPPGFKGEAAPVPLASNSLHSGMNKYSMNSKRAGAVPVKKEESEDDDDDDDDDDEGHDGGHDRRGSGNDGHADDGVANGGGGSGEVEGDREGGEHEGEDSDGDDDGRNGRSHDGHPRSSFTIAVGGGDAVALKGESSIARDDVNLDDDEEDDEGEAGRYGDGVGGASKEEDRRGDAAVAAVSAAAAQAAEATIAATSASAPPPLPPLPMPPTVPAAAGEEIVVPEGMIALRALYDYEATQEGDLSFAADDIILTREDEYEADGWLTGQCEDRSGVFPANYTERLA